MMLNRKQTATLLTVVMISLFCLGIYYIVCGSSEQSKSIVASQSDATSIMDCIKVDKINPNAFTEEPSGLAIWFARDNGTITIWHVKPSSPNYKLLSQLREYRKYKIVISEAKQSDGRPIIEYIKDLGDSFK